jgi:hypothetical protein
MTLSVGLWQMANDTCGGLWQMANGIWRRSKAGCFLTRSIAGKQKYYFGFVTV